MSTFRGHPIYWGGEQYRFTDTGEPTVSTWYNRPCGKCGRYGNSSDGLPDPCLGTLPGVDNACCGHGDRETSYVRFTNGVALRGFVVDHDQYKGAEIIEETKRRSTEER